MDETLFDDWDEPVLLIDSNQVVRRANQAAAALLGFKRHDFYGLPIERLLPFISQERFMWMRHVYEEAGTEAFNTAVPFTTIRKDGSRVRVWATFESARIQRGDWTWILLDAEDKNFPSTTLSAEAIAPDPESVKGIQVITADFGLRPHASYTGSSTGPIAITDTEIARLASDISEVLDFNILGTSWPEPESGTVTLDKLVHRDVKPTPERGAGSAFPLLGTITEEVLRSKSSVLVRSERKEDLRRRFPGAEPPGRRTQFPSNMCIPIFSGGGIACIVGIHSVKQVYRPEHLEVVSKCLNERFSG